MKTPPINLDVKINPFLGEFPTERVRLMIEKLQDSIRKKTIPKEKVQKARTELMEFQEIYKRRIWAAGKDSETWAMVRGCEVYILPTEQMGTVVGPHDALTVTVEWGENGQENDYYPEELEIRIPSHVWQIP